MKFLAIFVHSITLLTFVASAQVDPPCTIRTLVGNPVVLSGDDGPATTAHLLGPRGIAKAADGTILFADSLNNRIRKISPDGIISTIAGNGRLGISGDGGPATLAELNGPNELALDGTGNLYFLDQIGNRGRVRRITPDGIITTFAGNGTAGFGGDGGPATEAMFSQPSGLAVDAQGNVYVADSQNNRIRRVRLDGIVETVAGTGVRDFSGDGGPASEAALAYPRLLTFDPAGNLYVYGDLSARVRRIGLDGVIETVAGNGGRSDGEDGIPATSSSLRAPAGIDTDTEGNLYILDRGRFRKITDGIIDTVARHSANRFLVEEDGSFLLSERTRFSAPSHRIRRLSQNDTVETIAGIDPLWEGQEFPAPSMVTPGDITIGPSADVYFTDIIWNRIFRYAADGTMAIVAGGGDQSITEGMPATEAKLNRLQDIAIDPQGNLYFVMRFPNVVYRVAPSGTISRAAGGGGAALNPGSLDEQPALDVFLNSLEHLAAAPDGTLFIGLFGSGPLLRLTTEGRIQVVPVGRFFGSRGYFVDLKDMDVDADGAFYLTELGSSLKVLPDGRVERIAPGPRGRLSGDDNGNLYSSQAFQILKDSPDGYRTELTIRSGFQFHFGEGEDSTNAAISFVGDLETDPAGNLYILDAGIERVRRIARADECEGTQWPIISAWTNAATFQHLSGLTPGLIMTVFGQWLGPAKVARGTFSEGRLATEVAGVQVLFNGVPAPILFTSQRQTTVAVPFDVELPTTILFRYNGLETGAQFLAERPSSPGLFTLGASGSGRGAILNQDLSVNRPRNPARKGSFIVLFGTGMGRTQPPSDAGRIATGPLPRPILPVSVKIGGVEAEILYAGAAPRLIAGVLQVVAVIPPECPTGEAVPVTLHI